MHKIEGFLKREKDCVSKLNCRGNPLWNNKMKRVKAKSPIWQLAESPLEKVLQKDFKTP